MHSPYAGLALAPLWGIPPVLAIGFNALSQTENPMTQWSEYGVMGLTILALGLWTWLRQKTMDQDAKDARESAQKNAEAITELTRQVAAALAQAAIAQNTFAEAVNRYAMEADDVTDSLKSNREALDRLAAIVDKLQSPKNPSP